MEVASPKVLRAASPLLRTRQSHKLSADKSADCCARSCRLVAQSGGLPCGGWPSLLGKPTRERPLQIGCSCLRRTIYVSNFAQTSTAKECMRVTGMSGHGRGVPCRNRISSGNTLEKRCFRPARPKVMRSSRDYLSLRGPGHKQHYNSGSEPL